MVCCGPGCIECERAHLLAAVGVGGLFAYTGVLRRKEIAIRLALGGEPRRIVNAIMREGVLVASSVASWDDPQPEQRVNFASETTLAADLAVQRVAARVSAGGHNVPEETVRRRLSTVSQLVTGKSYRTDDFAKNLKLESPSGFDAPDGETWFD